MAVPVLLIWLIPLSLLRHAVSLRCSPVSYQTDQSPTRNYNHIKGKPEYCLGTSGEGPLKGRERDTEDERLLRLCFAPEGRSEGKPTQFQCAAHTGAAEYLGVPKRA